MGQPIPEHLRPKIKSKHDVREVTDQHIILRGGQVIDPGQYVVEKIPARIVLKLIECRCFFRRHQVGCHTIVPGHVWVYGNGAELPAFYYPTDCRGQWIVEEVMKR